MWHRIAQAIFHLPEQPFFIARNVATLVYPRGLSAGLQGTWRRQRFVLRKQGLRTRLAANAAEARTALEEGAFALVVLDVMMPGIDGHTVCRRICDKGLRTPVLMLTARHEIADRVAGLDAGADDYLVKPYALDELLARLRALLRRTSVTGTDGSTIQLGDLVLDASARQVTRSGNIIDLTKTEFDLLELLVHNTGIVLTRDVIYERIWGFDFETGSKSLDVYIGYL